MVKTGQFTTKCKGDKSHSSKTASITLIGFHLDR